MMESGTRSSTTMSTIRRASTTLKHVLNDTATNLLSESRDGMGRNIRVSIVNGGMAAAASYLRFSFTLMQAGKRSRRHTWPMTDFPTQERNQKKGMRLEAFSGEPPSPYRYRQEP